MRCPPTALATLALAAAFLLAVPAFTSGDDKPATTEEAIRKDRDAAFRYLRVRLERQQRLLKRGADAEALELEEDCLRHEVKCLQRYVWYIKHDKSLAPKAKALSAALEDLKKKQAKESLEERRKSGFKVAEVVVNPLGMKLPEPPPEPKPEKSTFDSGGLSVSVGKPSRSATASSADRFVGAKPPPGAEAPGAPPAEGDAGSAGSGGSGSDHK